MAMGSSLVSGYRSGQADQPRSLMPVINTMGSMIRARRAAEARGGGRRFVMNRGESGTDRRSRERENRRQLEKLAEEEKYRYEMDRQAQEKKTAEASELRGAEEARRQEAHETGMQKSAMELERGQVQAGREDKQNLRKDAYEAIKAGIMMRDPSVISAAFQDLMPEGGEDQVSYETLEDGTRKVTARPGKREVPQFIFHPDGYVGVQFPGEEKPVVFKNADEAFTNVVAPMNPQKWDSIGKTTPKDRVTAAKNEAEADYKDRKLQADIHADAHEAALQQFEADGYYQPALYNEDAYWKSYNEYVRRATGQEPVVKGGDQGARPSGTERGGQPMQYKGDDAPQGFPGARRGPRGGWYVQKKGKWYPILEGKEQGPATPKGEGGRRPMPGQRTADADNGEMQASGVGGGRKRSKKGLTKEQLARIKEVGIRKDFETEGKNISAEKGEGELYRGTAPPPEYPDAQLDRDENIWYYFDADSQQWREVRV